MNTASLVFRSFRLGLLFSIPRLSISAQALFVPGGTIGFSANGNVGIGTSTPVAALHVAGDSYIGNGSLFFADPGLPTINNAPWYGVGVGNLTLNGQTSVVQVAGFYGLNFKTAYGQMVMLDNGNVGIGTASPPAKLWVNTANPTSGAYVATGSGSYGVLEVGIPSAVDNKGFISLHRGGAVMHQLGISGFDLVFAVGGGASSLDLQSETLRITPSREVRLPGGTNPNGWSTHFNFAGKNYIRGDTFIADNGGNVGIGTTNPGGHKLAVNGAVRAKEVIVDTGWSDYVFAPGYELAPLSEVEAHIKEHQHLPGIPSAKEVAEQGVSVGEMQAKLLAKIEELTLHVIRLEKENSALRSRMNHVESQLTP